MNSQRGAAVVTATMSSLVLLAVAAFVFAWFLMPVGIGQLLASNCRVNGLGEGACPFTNTGWTPGTACAEVEIINADAETISSGTVCSGRVWPNDTVEKRISIIVGDHCKDRTYSDRSWSDVCHMNVVNK